MREGDDYLGGRAFLLMSCIFSIKCLSYALGSQMVEAMSSKGTLDVSEDLGCLVQRQVEGRGLWRPPPARC